MQQQYHDEEMAEKSGGGGRTVVVGVKLDSQGRELLTWALVKVAQPGDSVVAVHVLGKNEIVDRDGKSSLLSLVKAFDSVLAVYEGFCNLKQVNLKLKICRGSSIRKILVCEAKSYAAAKVVVGSDKHHRTIRPSTSVAKYCAKKLPSDCWVLAVSNGKIVYQRGGSPEGAENLKSSESSTKHPQGMKDHRPNSLLNVFHRTPSKNHRVLSEAYTNVSPKSIDDKGYFESLEQALMRASLECKGSVTNKNCSVCGPGSLLQDNSCKRSAEESVNGGSEGKSLDIVPVQGDENTTSLSRPIRKFPESRPGWPLLRRAVFPDQQVSSASVRRISVVQWALRLPSRHPSSNANLDGKQNSSDQNRDQCSKLDGESGAIVPFDIEAITTAQSPDNNSKEVPKELQGLQERHLATCRLFSYQDLLSATSNFLAENLVGKGGSSQVYRGSLADGQEVAVKILKPSGDLLKEFIMEIEIITTLHHKNIISLLGFCYEDNNLLLVYDFLSRGSLEENLHGSKKTSEAFGWSERYKVALGVAEALNYLHSGNAHSVIHRDVKSSNILLSDDFEPQLSDFGLAKWASTASSHNTCMDVAGTFGYLAPEYFMYGKVNEKIDIYAFGVVLLELLSGRKPISNDYPKGQESLIMWAEPLLNGGKLSQLLDPGLDSSYDHEQTERMALAATLCIRRAPRARPQMSLVLKLLQGDPEVTQWARLQVNASEEHEALDEEGCPFPNIQSHLNLALLDVENDSLSMSSVDQNFSLEDYLQGRQSRSSSLD